MVPKTRKHLYWIIYCKRYSELNSSAVCYQNAEVVVKDNLGTNTITGDQTKIGTYQVRGTHKKLLHVYLPIFTYNLQYLVPYILWPPAITPILYPRF